MRLGGFGFNGYKEILFGAGQQPVYKTLVRSGCAPDEPVFTVVDSLDVELLPGLNAILLPDFRREHNLAFGRNFRLHMM